MTRLEFLAWSAMAPATYEEASVREIVHPGRPRWLGMPLAELGKCGWMGCRSREFTTGLCLMHATVLLEGGRRR